MPADRRRHQFSAGRARPCSTHGRPQLQFNFQTVGLVDGFLESLAGPELGLLRCRNANGFASARITPLAGLAPGDCESTETDKPHFGFAPQRRRDGVEDAFNGTRRFGPGQPSVIGNSDYKIVLVHGYGPFWIDTGIRRKGCLLGGMRTRRIRRDFARRQSRSHRTAKSY